MAQSLARICLHVVFSTKNRESWLQDPDLRAGTHAYLAGSCRKLDSPSLVIGGVSDHVHILCSFGRSCAVADLIRELKRSSTKWVRASNLKMRGFQWQHGYGAFSISPSHVEVVKAYIRNQETHHRRESFQYEFRKLLRKYELEYDERFVWD